MRHICKTDAPKSLNDFNKGHHMIWKEIHEDRNKHVYEDCLTQCELDQEELCGYTEIPLSSGKKHIDRYIKRDTDPTLTFSWTNMVAAIKDYRFGADWKDDHIKKKDYDSSQKKYKGILNPLVDDMRGRFKFATNGFMEPSDVNDTMAENTIKMFNLNDETLQKRREYNMTAARSMYEGGLSKKEIIAYLASDGFISAVEYELSMV